MGDAQACMYYIGVRGVGNCSYMITASLNTGPSHPTSLYDGVPQAGAVNVSRYSYYRMHLGGDGHTQFSVSITPTRGDPDVFLLFAPTGTVPRVPGLGSYDYSSRRAYGTDRITVTPDQPHWCVRACVRACGRAGGRAGGGPCVRALLLPNPPSPFPCLSLSWPSSMT